jgi:hypothetical protein
MTTSGNVLPFIKSPHFGAGLGVFSLSPDPVRVISHVIGQGCDGDQLSVWKLYAAQETAERTIAEGEAKRQELRRGTYSAIACRIAEIVRGLWREWVLFSNGTIVLLRPDVTPIESPKQFTAAFGRYPFHRLRDDPHRDLMYCFLRTKAIADDDLRTKAFRAAHQLLNAGYPMPGCSDRYIFMPRHDTGIVWVVDDKPALGAYRMRASAADERDLLANRTCTIPTIDDPAIDARLIQSPLTMAWLDLSKIPPTVTRSEIYHAASDHGIENRRLDFMFPLPIALIYADGKVEIF